MKTQKMWKRTNCKNVKTVKRQKCENGQNSKVWKQSNAKMWNDQNAKMLKRFKWKKSEKVPNAKI